MYYFASDIHLGAGDAATARAVERRFVAWLDDAARDAEAIFLVGDIFDFWFEYRRVVPKGFVRTLGKLAELTDRGVRSRPSSSSRRRFTLAAADCSNWFTTPSSRRNRTKGFSTASSAPLRKDKTQHQLFSS